MIKARLTKIGLTGKMYTAHSLRHTCGVLLQIHGKDLYETQVYLRHSDPNITQLYTRMAEQMMREDNRAGKMIDRVLDGDI
jgi:integrase/recombinase XerC